MPDVTTETIDRALKQLNTETQTAGLNKILDEVYSPSADLAAKFLSTAQEQGKVNDLARAWADKNFALLDSDGNGYISAAELQKLQSNSFFKQGLTPLESTLVAHLAKNMKRIASVSNDEWGSESEINRKDLNLSKKVSGTLVAVERPTENQSNKTGSPASGKDTPLPDLILEYGKANFKDLDADGNGFLTSTEIYQISRSDKWSKALTTSERDLLEQLAQRIAQIQKAHNDEYFYENDGATVKDLEKYAEHEGRNRSKLPDKPGDYKQKLIVDGETRTFNIHIPKNYDGKTDVPVVVFLHHLFGDGKSAAQTTELSKKADAENFIAIYPDATGLVGDHLRTWHVGKRHQFCGVDDVEFLSRLIDKASTDLTVDTRRIYIGGFSNGGMMAHEAAARLSDKVAAAASISGCMTGKESKPKEPVSTLIIHGTGDRLVPFEGRASWLKTIGMCSMQPVSYATDFWSKNIQASEVSVETEGNIMRSRFLNPQTGAEVVQISLVGARHGYPGSPAPSIDGRVNHIDATEVMWNFFRGHQKDRARLATK